MKINLTKQYSVDDLFKLNLFLEEAIKKYIDKLKASDNRHLSYLASVNLRLMFYTDDLFIPSNEKEEAMKKSAVEIFNTIFSKASNVQTLADFNCYLYTVFPTDYLDNIMQDLILSIYRLIVDNDSGKREKKKTLKLIKIFFKKYDFAWIMFYIKYVFLYRQ